MILSLLLSTQNVNNKIPEIKNFIKLRAQLVCCLEVDQVTLVFSFFSPQIYLLPLVLDGCATECEQLMFLFFSPTLNNVNHEIIKCSSQKSVSLLTAFLCKNVFPRCYYITILPHQESVGIVSSCNFIYQRIIHRRIPLLDTFSNY